MQLAKIPWSRLATGALIALGLAFVITQVASVFTERINWDEFLLMQRGEIAIKLDRIEGGGRPGLGVFAILPFVAGCTDPIDAIVNARLLWAAITVGLLAGLFVLLRLVLRNATGATHAAALGTACVALVPVFMRWSIQVRTDQPALGCVIWGGVALVVSQTRVRMALLGGLFTGLGYLFSQKAIYVGGLTGLLALAMLFIEGTIDLRRDIKRAALFASGIVIPILAYKLIVPLFYVPPVSASFGGGMDTFAYYRTFLGYRVYRGMIPLLYPHLLVAGALMIALTIAYRRRSELRKPLLMAIVVATAGVVVGWFHAAAFPYFWMTLGLFAGASIALAWPAIAAVLGRASIAVAAMAWLLLLFDAAPFARELLQGSQAPQRDSFAFIARNFPASARGFHTEGGLFCRTDPEPFAVYVRQHVVGPFFGPDGERMSAELVQQFRSRPVSFLLTPGLELFPSSVQEFWNSHYVLYDAAVLIAGFRISSDAVQSLDVIVPGTYRWLGSSELVIDGRNLPAQATIDLRAQRYDARTSGQSGMLVLAVTDPPRKTRGAFHSISQLSEIVGGRLW